MSVRVSEMGLRGKSGGFAMFLGRRWPRLAGWARG